MIPTEKEIIERLAGGARIVATDEGDGYSYKIIDNESVVSGSQVIQLLDKGWIYSSNTAYFLSDEGKKAYLRSSDEMSRNEHANDAEVG